MGYWFYARFLALVAFPEEPGHPAAAGPDATPATFTLGLLHHGAVLSGGTTVAGVAIAVIWGWVPAFLWILVATVAGGGVLGLASLWLSRQHDARPLSGVLAALLGARVGWLARGLGFVVLTLAGALLLRLLAQTLAAHTEIVLPLVAQVIMAMFAARWMRGNTYRSTSFVIAGCLILPVLVVAAGEATPVAFTGTMDLRVGVRSAIVLDGTLLWMTLLLGYLLFSLRRPLADLAQPRGFLSGGLLGMFLVAMLFGIVFLHPPLVAPPFNQELTGPGPVPWLFLVLTGGALAGIQALIASGTTVRQLPAGPAARRLGYGGALINGSLALVVLGVTAAGFANLDDWRAVYGSTDVLADPGKALEIFVVASAQFLAALGIPRSWGLALAAFVVASLLATTLECLLRAQRYLVEDALPAGNTGTMLWLVLGSVAALALFDGRGQGGILAWPALGPASLLLAALALGGAAVFLRRTGRPVTALVVPAVAALAAAAGALALRLVESWATAAWWSFGIAATGGIVALWGMIEILVAWRDPRPHGQADAEPSI